MTLYRAAADGRDPNAALRLANSTRGEDVLDTSLKWRGRKRMDFYQFFQRKMGRVEIMFDNLLPCSSSFHLCVKSSLECHSTKCGSRALPRDESRLVRYQYESTRIFDMMKQRR